MKTNIKHLKNYTLLLLIVFMSCGPNKDLVYNNGQFCNGKSVLKFNSLADIQSQHRTLTNAYNQNNEDVNVLVNFENSKLHKSLRKKDEDMDFGLIPDDPNFDPFDFTTDDILETFLNQDGMVIIGNYLYLWDDGCVLLRILNSCDNYRKLLHYKTLIEQSYLNPSNQNNIDVGTYRFQNKIEHINSCNDIRYDFETITEDNIKLEGVAEFTNTNRSAGCGYEAYLEHEFVSKDTNAESVRYRLTANTIQIGTDVPFHTIYFDGVDSAGIVTIVDGSLPYLTGSDLQSLQEGLFGLVYPGKWVEIEIDYSLVNQLDITLASVVKLFSGNSCPSTDTLQLDLTCTQSISKKPLNGEQGEWVFRLEGVSISPSTTVKWSFGDGSADEITTGLKDIIHKYPIPCGAAGSPFTVRAQISNPTEPLCKELSVDFVSSNSCALERFRLSHKDKINGKKVRLVVKMKKKWWGIPGNSKWKNKFRWRVDGTKKIETIGFVQISTGSNICKKIDLGTLMSNTARVGNPKTLTAKKKLKQKIKATGIHSMDKNNPYSVTFSHSDPNFITQTLSLNEPCGN